MISFPFASANRGQHESEVDHEGNQERDRKTESGITSAGRQGKDEGQASTAGDFSSGQEADRSRSAGEMGKDSGSKEIALKGTVRRSRLDNKGDVMDKERSTNRLLFALSKHPGMTTRELSESSGKTAKNRPCSCCEIRALQLKRAPARMRAGL